MTFKTWQFCSRLIAAAEDWWAITLSLIVALISLTAKSTEYGTSHAGCNPKQFKMNFNMLCEATGPFRISFTNIAIPSFNSGKHKATLPPRSPCPKPVVFVDVVIFRSNELFDSRNSTRVLAVGGATE